MNFTQQQFLFVFEFKGELWEHTSMSASDYHFSGLYEQEKTSDRKKARWERFIVFVIFETESFSCDLNLHQRTFLFNSSKWQPDIQSHFETWLWRITEDVVSKVDTVLSCLLAFIPKEGYHNGMTYLFVKLVSSLVIAILIKYAFSAVLSCNSASFLWSLTLYHRHSLL